MDAVKGLCIALRMDDEEIQQDACWGLQYAADVEGDNQEQHQRFSAIAQSKAMHQLVHLLDHKSRHLVHPAVRALGSLLTGTNDEAEYLVDTCGVLGGLGRLLTPHSSYEVRREVCWTISNITAGSEGLIRAVMTANLFQPLIHILKNDREGTAKEALWALANAINSGSDEVVAFLVQQGVIWPLFKFMKIESSVAVLNVSLEAISNVLAAGKRQSGQEPRRCPPSGE